MPNALWQGRQRGQPSGRLPQLRGDFADPVFLYLPSSSLLVAYPYFPGSVATGTVALANGIQGNLPSAPVVAQMSTANIVFGQRSRDIAFPNGMTVLAVGSYSTSSGINALVSRGATSDVGGFSIEPYNTFGSPANRVYGGVNIAGSGTSWDSGWIGASAQPSSKDSSAGGGGYSTATNTRYAIATTTTPGHSTAASTTNDLSVGGFPGFANSSWVEFVAIWDRHFPEALLEKIASDSYSIFQPQRRIFLGADSGGVSSTTATAAAGVATVSAVGSSTAATVGAAAAGTATVSGVGAAGSQTVGTAAAGAATVSGVGAANSQTVATAADGVATVSATAQSTAATTGAAAGVATTSAEGSSSAGTVATAAAGAATVSAGGSSVAETVATPAAGTATVSGVGSEVTEGQTTAIPADGVATVSAVGSSIAATNAVPAAGTSTVSATTPAAAVPADSGGGGSKSRKRKKGQKGPIYYRHIEPEDLARFEQVAQEIAQEPEQPKPQAKVRAVSLLKQYGIYQDAYIKALLQLEQELRKQQLEDDELMQVIAAFL